MKKIFIILYCAMVLAGTAFLPVTAIAQTEPGKGYQLLVPCKGKPLKGVGENTCTFIDLMTLIDRIIQLMLYLAMILAVISFIYAGFKLLFSGGNEEAISTAKHIFWSVLIGLVLAYGAWVIVHFLLTTLGVKTGYTLLS